MAIERGAFTPPPPFSSRPSYAPKSCKSESRKSYHSTASPSPTFDRFHVIHKVPADDSPYVRAKRVQLIEKDPIRSISLFWRAINSDDRVDSALKDMALVMKQLDRSDEAIEAIRSFRHLCSKEAQESLDNILIELYKRSGRMEEQVKTHRRRKRMSVIVETEEGKLLLLSKGANSVMFTMLAKGGAEYEEQTREHIHEYADAGLRTLMLAYRKVSKKEYEEFNFKFSASRNSVSADRDAMIDQVAETIEKDLILLGATAVEDKLQPGVSECIDKLAQAGIKIWVLTGDKMGTAINIGFACSMLRQGMKQIIITLDAPEIKALEKEGKKGAIIKSVSNFLSFRRLSPSSPDSASLRRSRILSSKLYFDVQPSKVPLIYSSFYDIAFLDIEKLHPFDSSKWGRICQFLISAGALDKKCIVHSEKYLKSLKRSSIVAKITEVSPVAMIPNFMSSLSIRRILSKSYI